MGVLKNRDLRELGGSPKRIQTDTATRMLSYGVGGSARGGGKIYRTDRTLGGYNSLRSYIYMEFKSNLHAVEIQLRPSKTE